jgi:glycosyltransferase involved in cell wall biosynthesis
MAVVEHARARGIVTVREMINTFQGTAKAILDEVYARLGLPPGHTITQAAVEAEIRELALYDYVCASNAPCEASLAEAGVAADRVIPTSFGWSPARFGSPAAVDEPGQGDHKTRFLFVGSIGVRKGVPALLEAWARAGLDASLTLVGNVEPAIAPLLARAAARGRVSVLPYTPDIGALYRSSDIFIFPTLEEGGPQVTIEAGGCGLPVITTPMGTGRLVRDGVNGIVVAANAPDQLAGAMVELAGDKALRRQYAARIAEDAGAFTYDRLGAARARAFEQRLVLHRTGSPVEA